MLKADETRSKIKLLNFVHEPFVKRKCSAASVAANLVSICKLIARMDMKRSKVCVKRGEKEKKKKSKTRDWFDIHP